VSRADQFERAAHDRAARAARRLEKVDENLKLYRYQKVEGQGSQLVEFLPGCNIRVENVGGEIPSYTLYGFSSEELPEGEFPALSEFIQEAFQAAEFGGLSREEFQKRNNRKIGRVGVYPFKDQEGGTRVWVETNGVNFRLDAYGGRKPTEAMLVAAEYMSGGTAVEQKARDQVGLLTAEVNADPERQHAIADEMLAFLEKQVQAAEATSREFIESKKGK